MKTVTGRIALVALCATALTSVTQNAHALVTFDIVPGASLLSLIPSQFPGYGTAISQDNVVNSGTAGQTVADGLSGASWIASTTSSPAYLTVVGLSGPQTYNVKFSYLGSESNDVNQFTSGAITPFPENNANNNCGGCALPGGLPLSPQTGIASIGTNSGLTATIVPFTLRDIGPTGSGSLSNGTANAQPGSGISNLIFSYATFNPAAGLNGMYTLTSSVTDFVVFGFNDNGGADDNHDDFLGVAQLQVLGQGTQGDTPLPAALPLFGSVVGGGFLFRRLRNRRRAGAQGAVA